MPIEVSVGPPVLTINQGSTFMVTEQDGQTTTKGELGVFANDHPLCELLCQLCER